MRTILPLVIGASAIVFTACGTVPTDGGARTPAAIEIIPLAPHLAMGDTLMLVATVRDGEGSILPSASVGWSTSDPGVATVSAVGTLVGRGLGTATVTAASGVTAAEVTATVTVGRAVEIIISGVPNPVVVGDSATIEVTARDRLGNLIPDPVLTWSNSRPDLATLSDASVLTGLEPGDGAITVWIDEKARTAPLAVRAQFATVSASDLETCAITTNGALLCWGGGALGRDANDYQGSNRPIRIAPDLRFNRIEPGGVSCALTSDGTAYCWGFEGRVGDGSYETRWSPTMVAGGLTFTAISTDVSHSCGLTAAGAAYCWGSNIGGALGTGTPYSQTTPTAVTGGHVFRSISAGRFYTCGVTVDQVGLCWGLNDSLTLGTGEATFRMVPDTVAGSIPFSVIETGVSHTCGLATDGTAYCWGKATYGALGTDTTSVHAVPQPVLGGIAFTALAVGDYHTCGLDTIGAAYCWGLNLYDELGHAGDQIGWEPGPVDGGLTWTSLTAGTIHTCGMTPAGLAYCWGDGLSGQIGTGGTTKAPTPTLVGGQATPTPPSPSVRR